MEKNDYLERLLAKVHVKFVNDPLPADLRTRFPAIRGPLGKDLTYDELDKYPGLQEALAFILHYTPSRWLLEQEAPEIQKRRILHQWRPDTRDFPWTSFTTPDELAAALQAVRWLDGIVPNLPSAEELSKRLS